MMAAAGLLRRLRGLRLYTRTSAPVLAHLSDPALLLLMLFSSHLTPAAFFKCACIMRGPEEPEDPPASVP